jgi:hypothetical protein
MHFDKIINTIYKIIVGNFIITLIFTCRLYSQSCYENDPCKEDWISETFSVDYGPGTIYHLYVEYKYRNCNGVLEIVIDYNTSYITYSSFFYNDSYYQDYFDSGRELMEMETLNNMLWHLYFDNKVKSFFLCKNIFFHATVPKEIIVLFKSLG